MQLKLILRSLSLGLLLTTAQSKSVKYNCDNFKTVIGENDEIRECAQNKNGDITSLTFSGKPNATIIEEISTMTSLVNLQIFDQTFDNVDLQPLKKLTKLNTLHVECPYGRQRSRKYNFKNNSFKKLKKVKKLSIRGFTINESVLQDISDMPKLEDLTLQTCYHVAKDYSSLTKLKKTLKYLTLRSHLYNEGYITEFPESILSLTKLKNLTVTYQEISEIPQKITQLVNLETLELNNNLLNVMPSFLSELPKLKYLNLNGNTNLEGNAIVNENLELCDYVNTKVCKTQDLGCLVNDIPLCEVEEKVDDCTVIKNIYSERGISVKFEDDDCVSDKDGNVSYLYFRDNKGLTEEDIEKIFSFETLTEINILWIGSEIVKEKIPLLKNVETLSFYSRNGLKIDIEILKNLPKLTDLHVGCPENKNFSLTENSLKYLTNLKRLSFKELRVSQMILNEICSLTKLQSLEFENSSFADDLDYSGFTKLTDLTELIISGYNRYGKPTMGIPSTFYNLTKLKTLYMVRQNISEISNDISNLKNLEILNLSINKLTTLPDVLNDLPNLKSVNFEYNYLEGKTLTNENLESCVL